MDFERHFVGIRKQVKMPKEKSHMGDGVFTESGPLLFALPIYIDGEKDVQSRTPKPSQPSRAGL